MDVWSVVEISRCGSSTLSARFSLFTAPIHCLRLYLTSQRASSTSTVSPRTGDTPRTLYLFSSSSFPDIIYRFLLKDSVCFTTFSTPVFRHSTDVFLHHHHGSLDLWDRTLTIHTSREPLLFMFLLLLPTRSKLSITSDEFMTIFGRWWEEGGGGYIFIGGGPLGFLGARHTLQGKKTASREIFKITCKMVSFEDILRLINDF